MDTTGAG